MEEFTYIDGIWLIKQSILKESFLQVHLYVRGQKEEGADTEESIGQSMKFLSI